MLTRYGRLTQRQVAGVLGLRSGAAVSIQLRRIQEAIAKDPATRRQVETLERKLDKIVADLSFKG
jgi:antitoxin component of MazEF toxin-antitoxin module